MLHRADKIIAKALSAALILSGCSLGTPASLSIRPMSETVSTSSGDETRSYPLLKKRSFHSGAITISVDSAIGPKQTGARRLLLALSDDKHQSNEHHGAQGGGRYFNPQDPNSFGNVDSGYGDHVIATEAGSITVSTCQFNGRKAREFISGQLTVKSTVPLAELTEKLNSKYPFEIIDSVDDYYLLRLDLARISISELPNHLEGINELNVEAVQDAKFSSINAAKMAEAVLDIQLNFSDIIAYAELSYLDSVTGWSTKPVETTNYDDMFWWFKTIKVKEAWEYSIGSDVKIAVIDRGFDITNHPENKRNLFDSGRFSPGKDLPTSNVNGQNVYDAKPSNIVGRYHGGLVSQFAAAERNNGISAAGVAPNSRLMAYYADSGDSMWPTVKAIKYVASKGVGVVNISMAKEYDTFLWNIKCIDDHMVNWEIDSILRKHPSLVIVVAAGNDSVGPSKWAMVDDNVLQSRRDVIVVGGISPVWNSGTLVAQEQAPFSNVGDNVDIWAPADGVGVADPRVSRAEAKESLEGSGTSFASPMVAGAVALIKQRRPSVGVKDVIAILRDSAEKVPSIWKDGSRGGVANVGGYVDGDKLPVLNVAEAVKLAASRTGVSVATWQAKSWEGIITYNEVSNTYGVFENGTYRQFRDSVPADTYEYFYKNAPANSSGNRYVKVRGWQRSNGIEVLNVEAVTPPVSPYRLAIGEFEWVGLNQDKVSTNGYIPDGILDGHFKLTLSFNTVTVVRSLTLYTIDAAGNKCCGQVWDTLNPNWWILGVFFQGAPINTAHTIDENFGTFYPNERPQFDLELNGNTSGFFYAGQRFMVEIILDDGTIIQDFTVI